MGSLEAFGLQMVVPVDYPFRHPLGSPPHKKVQQHITLYYYFFISFSLLLFLISFQEYLASLAWISLKLIVAGSAIFTG